ncbi:MAG: MFS transporter [Rubrivivax sp.]|nr:MFS transporter [Rubrivivax sp.]
MPLPAGAPITPDASAASAAASPGPASGPVQLPGLAEVLRYGLLGLPLAFVALPMVVQWPAYAAAQWGVPLAVLGALLLAVRLGDAFIDPWIGRWADRWFAQGRGRPWQATALAALALMAGFVALFFVPASVAGTPTQQTALLIWLGVALVVTYTGFSVAQVVHSAWAARLGGDEVARSRWVGAREAFALLGVLSASVLPTLAGWTVTSAVLAVLLLLGLASLRAVRAGPGPGGAPAARVSAPLQPDAAAPADALSPWRVPAFRSLLAVYTLNGLAASIPASLVLFFVRDRIQAPAVFEAVFLAAYFGAAALAVPLWIRCVARIGLARTWALGMLLAIVAFVGAVTVGAGQTGLFLAICIASGLALGTDLVAPAALLAGVIQRSGVEGRAEGRWFGWWSMATKLTLALAAGIALPLVQWLGYQPGGRDEQALMALAVVYAVVPCAIKALALALLWMRRHDWNDGLTMAASAQGKTA